MTPFNFKEVVHIISSSSLYEKMMGVPRGLTVEALVASLMREIEGEVVRYIPARKVLVFAIPQGAIWFDYKGQMFYHNGITVRTDFTSKPAVDVLGEVFDLLKELSKKASFQPTPPHAATDPYMQTAAQDVMGNLNQAQEALMVEFREKLSYYATNISRHELPGLSQEIMALQQRMAQFQQLQQQANMVMGQQSPFSGFGNRIVWGRAPSLKETVRGALGNTFMVIDQLPGSELERAAQIAFTYIRQHRPELTYLIPRCHNRTEYVHFLRRVAYDNL